MKHPKNEPTDTALPNLRKEPRSKLHFEWTMDPRSKYRAVLREIPIDEYPGANKEPCLSKDQS